MALKPSPLTELLMRCFSDENLFENIRQMWCLTNSFPLFVEYFDLHK